MIEFVDITAAYDGRAIVYLSRGEYERSIADYTQAISVVPKSSWYYSGRGRANFYAGLKDKAQQILDTLNEPSNGSAASPFFIAAIYGELGDKEQAFAWLEKAYDEHSGLLVYLNVVPMLDSLRADERFRKLTLRVGLPK